MPPWAVCAQDTQHTVENRQLSLLGRPLPWRLEAEKAQSSTIPDLSDYLVSYLLSLSLYTTSRK